MRHSTSYIFILLVLLFSFFLLVPQKVFAKPLSQEDLQQAQEIGKAAEVDKEEFLNKNNILDAATQKPVFKSPLSDFPPLVRFMVGITILLLAPSLSRRCKLPEVVGLIIAGIIFGPYAFGLMHSEGQVIVIFSELGKLLLLFFAGMEIDLILFNKAKWRASFFGTVTLLIPLFFGIFIGLVFGYSTVSAVLIGSLLASHTLLGYPILQKYKLLENESVLVTVSATIFTDTVSLIILAICVSIHTMGFQPINTIHQIIQILLYVFIIIFGLSKIVQWYFKKFNPSQDVQMLVLLIIVMAAATLAEMIHLESIVGAFMAGLAVNRCLRGTKTHEHIEVLGKTLFVPAFFFAIGLSLDLPKIWESINKHFLFVILLSAGLISAKLVAAWITGLVFKYKKDEWLNMWSLSMPQVAATIAAALVAFQSLDSKGNRLIDQNVMSGVLVMVVITAIGGPILTEVFAKRIKGIPVSTDTRVEEKT